ncbi:hypothetical protein D9M71_242660 [compost metagenome]
MQHVVIAFAYRTGLQLGGIEAGIGLGDHETGAMLAGNQRRQHAVLLLFATEFHHRIEAENIHVHG